MNREDRYLLYAMAARQKQLYESITTGAIVYLLYTWVGGYGLITIGVYLVSLVILVFVIRFMVNLVRRLWLATETIRYKISYPFCRLWKATMAILDTLSYPFRRLWKATQAIRSTLYRLFTPPVLYLVIWLYLVAALLLNAIYEGAKSLLGMIG